MLTSMCTSLLLLLSHLYSLNSVFFVLLVLASGLRSGSMTHYVELSEAR